jgi:glycosyltransferase involved in cell wall biosynthesis
MKSSASYVLITPARNEGAFLETTIRSVVAQTVRPLRWVIVSDGSTDQTDAIASRYAREHDWIELVRMPERQERSFAGKVFAFRAGLSRVEGLPYDFVGALDADLSFNPDYFEFLLAKAAADPGLGLVGTPFAEDGRTYDYRFASLEHVSGACQLFRRKCFEDIGGYQPLPHGGIDLVAVLTARMRGWRVRTFTERVLTHHRKQGSASRRGLAVVRNDGRKDYLLGADPVWETLRCVFRAAKRPYIIGGLYLFMGYFGPLLRRQPRAVSPELVKFRRRDQRRRLFAIVHRLSAAPFRQLPGYASGDAAVLKRHTH